MNRHMLKALRLRHHLSLTALAARIGITVEQLSKMESGKCEVTENVANYMRELGE